MYRFEAQPVFHSLDARNVRPEPTDQEDWDSSLNFLWQLERQAHSPSQASTSSTAGLLADSLPVHYVESSIRDDSPVKHIAKAAFARNSLDRYFIRQKRSQQPEQEIKAVAGALKAGQVIEPIPDQRKLHEDLQYSEGQQAAQEAEAEMLKALASSNAAEHLAAMELLNASQTAAIKDNPSIILPEFLVKILMTPIDMMIAGSSIHVTTTQMTHLSLAELKKLYTVMVCKLRDHLVAYQACDTDKTTYQALSELGVQVATLLMCQLKNNLLHSIDIHQNGVGGKPLTGYLPTDDGSVLLALLGHTDSQIADLLMLRQLFYTRLAHLTAARRESLEIVSRYAMQDRLHEAGMHTERLRSVVAAQYHTYLQFAAALYLGIHTARQLAVGMVYSFPMAFGSKMVETIASTRGAPSFASLMDLQVPKPAGYCWEDVTKYLKNIKPHNLHDYVPFMSSNIYA